MGNLFYEKFILWEKIKKDYYKKNKDIILN